MKYVATINYTEQVSPDDWERTMKHMEVTPDTRVQDIMDWVKNHDRGRVQSFTVREVEQVKKYTTEHPLR